MKRNVATTCTHDSFKGPNQTSEYYQCITTRWYPEERTTKKVQGQVQITDQLVYSRWKWPHFLRKFMSTEQHDLRNKIMPTFPKIVEIFFLCQPVAGMYLSYISILNCSHVKCLCYIRVIIHFRFFFPPEGGWSS